MFSAHIVFDSLNEVIDEMLCYFVFNTLNVHIPSKILKFV